MILYLRLLLIILLFLFIDAIYFLSMGILMQSIKMPTLTEQIELVQKSTFKPKVSSIILCYLVMSFGLYYFIIKDKKSPFNAFLLGFLIYSTYDLTNYSTLTDWKLSTTVIDSLWGGTIFALITWINIYF